MLLMVWTRMFDIVFAMISCMPSFVRGVRYCMSYIPDQARPREFACKLALWAHSHTRGPCVGKHHASTPTRTKQGPKAMGRNGRQSLSRFLSFNTCAHVGVLCAISMCIVCDCLYLYVWLCAYPNSGATYWVFYIIFKPRTTHIFR